MEERAHLYIDFVEGDQSTYRCVELSIGDKIKIKFDSGDPVIDYANYMKFIMDCDNISVVTHSSMVDHFFMDGEEFFELCFDKDLKPIPHDLEVLDKMTMDELNSMIKFIGRDKMKTFADLKKYYRLHRGEKFRKDPKKWGL